MDTLPDMERAAERTRRESGENSQAYVAILNDLGGLYRTLGHYDRSEAAFAKAAEIQSRTTGKNTPDYATTITNLAGTYRMKGRFDAAEHLFFEAMDVFERTVGTHDFRYASALNNLGLVYQSKKEYQKAEPLHLRALDILKSNVKTDVAVASTLNNLAAISMAKGSIQDAENHLEEALKIYERSVGTKSPLYITGVNNLASLYFRTERYAEAAQLFINNLEACERVLGKDHPNCAMMAENIALTSERMGDNEKAERYYNLAMSMNRRKQGESDQTLRHSMEALVRFYEKTGQHDKARELSDGGQMPGDSA